LKRNDLEFQIAKQRNGQKSKPSDPDLKGEPAVSSGQLEVDFASDQVGDGDEIAQ